MDHANSQKMLAHCPVCHAAYLGQAVRLLGEQGPSRLFHCSCASCGNAILAVVLEREGTVSSIGLVTDLELQDALRWKDALPIRQEDIIEIHRQLEAGSADFCRFLLDKKA